MLIDELLGVDCHRCASGEFGRVVVGDFEKSIAVGVTQIAEVEAGGSVEGVEEVGEELAVLCVEIVLPDVGAVPGGCFGVFAVVDA